jgi:hypothetical protein
MPSIYAEAPRTQSRTVRPWPKRCNATSPAAAVTFVLFERDRSGAMVPLDIFRNSAFDAALAVAAVPPARSGTASGLVNTARMVGATLGIAVLGSIYAAHLQGDTPQGMLGGLRWAYLGGAIGELSGALIALAFTRANSTAEKKV